MTQGQPDWSTAPEWARYVAMDGNGRWYWYENRPLPGMDAWNEQHGRLEAATATGLPAWERTLAERPA